MGLIICESRRVTNPLYIYGLGINVYSLEELAYVIYNYPLLALDDFVDDRLLEFVQSDLNITLPTIRMDKEDILFSVLNATDYYSSNEIEKYKYSVIDFKKLSKYEFLKQKADLLFELSEYGKAIETYQRAVADAETFKADEDFYFRVYKSIGNCYANLFDTDKSFDAYSKACSIKDDRDILKRIYFLTKFENIIDKKEIIMKYLDDRVDSSWDDEYERILNETKDSDYLKEINAQFDQDSVKRHNAIINILNKWKHNYRNLLH